MQPRRKEDNMDYCKKCLYYTQYALGYCPLKEEVVHPNTISCKDGEENIKREGAISVAQEKVGEKDARQSG